MANPDTQQHLPRPWGCTSQVITTRVGSKGHSMSHLFHKKSDKSKNTKKNVIYFKSKTIKIKNLELLWKIEVKIQLFVKTIIS